MASLLINQGTNSAVFFEDVSGTAFRQSVAVDHGTITLSNPTGTTVQFNNGTVNLLGAGTITKLEQGSIQITAGTIATLGTMGTLGLVNTVTTVSNLSQGSINVTAGTIATLGTMGTLGLVNTVSNLSQGSINVTAGTIATLGTMGTLGLVNTVTTVSNLSNGSIKVTAGTEVVTSGSVNVIAGTVNTGTINAGTINTGTINVGTFRQDWRPSQVLVSFGTMTAATIGTIVAAPSAGSALFVSALDIVAVTGTAEVVVAIGVPGAGGGAGVLARGNFIAGGGISKPFPIPNSANSTGTALTWNIVGGSGSVAFNVAYFVAVP